MVWEIPVRTVPVAASVVASSALCVVAWYHREYRHARPLIVLSFGAAWWATTSVVGAATTELATKRAVYSLSYPAIGVVSVAWYVFTAQYTGRLRPPTRREAAALSVVPVGTGLAAATNDAHGLVWTAAETARRGTAAVMVVDHGPVFWIHAVQAYALIGGGTVMLLTMVVRSDDVYRTQAAFLIAAAVVPLGVNAAYFVGLTGAVDLTPAAFSLSGVVLLAAVLRARLLRQFPLARELARDRVLDEMSDAVLVTDDRGTVVDRNDAAAAQFGAVTVGSSLSATMPELAAVVASDSPAHFERENRHYEVETTRLQWGGRTTVGRLVVVRDVTATRRRERRLERERDRLAAVFDAVPHPLVRVTGPPDDPTVERANEEFENVFGAAESAFAEQPLDAQTLPGTDADEPARREVTVSTADGEDREFLFASAATDHTDTTEWIGAYVDVTERNRQVEILEQIRQNVTDVVWMSEVDETSMGKGSMEFVSDSYEDIWGRPPASLRADPTTFVDGIHPSDRDRVEAALADQATNPDEYEETYRVVTPDGETKWVHDRSSGVYADGRLQRVIGVATEITERKRRERELTRERRFFEQAIDALSDVFYVVDTDGTLRRWNDRLAAVTGRTELDGVDAAELFVPEDRAKIRTAIRTATTDGSASVEATLSTADGDRVPYEFTGSRLDDETGAPSGVVGIGRDLSERNERERTLRTFRRAVEHAGSMIYWFTEDGTLEYVNRAFERQTGYDASAVVGDETAPLAANAVTDGVESELFDTLQRGETWEAEFDTRDAAGERRTVRQTVTPVTHDDSVVRFVGVAVDVTDEENRKQQLSVLHRMLRHDLRNDLNEILLSAQLAGRETDDPAVRRHLDAAEETVEDTLSLSRDVARFRQLFESGEVESHAVELATVAREQVNSLRTERPDAELSVELSDAVPVRTNDLIDRAIRNLLRNAVEHNDSETPLVRVTATRRTDADEIALRIADDGPGIPQETIDVLRSDGETPLHHLDGFGLWLVNWVMSLSGGRVEFDRLDEGTAVTLVFPVARKEGEGCS
ncbi:MAG: histidine kinase N-terminal 7TM domain-containing protein [Halobaculum sp.]